LEINIFSSLHAERLRDDVFQWTRHNASNPLSNNKYTNIRIRHMRLTDPREWRFPTVTISGNFSRSCSGTRPCHEYRLCCIIHNHKEKWIDTRKKRSSLKPDVVAASEATIDAVPSTCRFLNLSAMVTLYDDVCRMLKKLIDKLSSWQINYEI